MIDIINRLKDLLNGNQSDRLIKEKSQQTRIADTNLLRHTVYKGDRTIQQLGQEPIENGVILSNQSLAIGDVMLPLAKGNVLRRVDNTNGGALLGTAYRDALENDYDANGNRRSSSLSRNGGNEPNNPNNPNKPKPKSDRVPPPFGCTPPPPKCFWSRNPIAPRGFQSHGSAVVNENGIPVYLHCASGVNAPSNLNCSFLDPQRWSCSGGVCSPNPSGVYTSQTQCEAALIPPSFMGGQCVVIYTVRYILYQTNMAGVESLAFSGEETQNIQGAIGAARVLLIGLTPSNGYEQVKWQIQSNGGYFQLASKAGGGGLGVTSARVETIFVSRLDGHPDNCGNLPSTCPI